MSLVTDDAVALTVFICRVYVYNAREQSDNGDVIDCVHVYHQPELKHPSARTATLQFQVLFS